jgi:hyperosmotically inducible protein
MKHWLRLSLFMSALAVAPAGSALAQSSDAKPPTADNQKNDKTDIHTTADIRKAIVDDKTLSTRAHNVKVITRNGAVTLRGHVQSQDEEKAIVAKAEEVAGHGNVTDELKVSAAK